MNMLRVMVVTGTAPAFSIDGFICIDARWATEAPFRAFAAARVFRRESEDGSAGAAGTDVARGRAEAIAPLAARSDRSTGAGGGLDVVELRTDVERLVLKACVAAVLPCERSLDWVEVGRLA